jgi:hypothetical protein
MLRPFDQVSCELEQVLFRLQNSRHDPAIRLKLLKQLRALLDEADIVIASEEIPV